jgi:hypothetical protein
MQMADMKAQETPEEEGKMDRYGRKLTEWAEHKMATAPMAQPDRSEAAGDESWFKQKVMEGVRSTVLSMAPIATAGAGFIAGGAMTGGSPVGAGAGAIAGGAAGVASLFGLATYHKQREELRDTDLPDEEKHAAARDYALIEAGGEAVADLVDWMLLKTGRVIGASQGAKNITKATIRSLLKTPPKEIAKRGAQVYATEWGTETVQGKLQSDIDARTGLGEQMGYIEAAIETAIPVAVMTLTFGAFSGGLTANERRKVKKDLNSDKVEDRIRGANRILSEIDDPEIAKSWKEMSIDTIRSGGTFDFDENIVEYVRQVQDAPKPAGPVSRAAEIANPTGAAEREQAGEKLDAQKMEVLSRARNKQAAGIKLTAQEQAALEAEAWDKTTPPAKEMPRAEGAIPPGTTPSGTLSRIVAEARYRRYQPGAPGGTDAESIRGDEGQIQGPGIERPGGEAEGGQDIQQQQEAGAEAGIEGGQDVRTEREGGPGIERDEREGGREGQETGEDTTGGIRRPPGPDREETGRDAEEVRRAAGLEEPLSTETVERPDSIAVGQDVNVTPTEPMKEAENYKKAHVKLDGFDISVENPVGSVRSGKDKAGKEWSQEIKADYGYFKGSVGFDKDHVDTFIKPGYKGGAQTAYIVNQVKPDGKFDEHKVVLGAGSEQEAMEIYNSNYEEGWTGGKNVVAMPMGQFKEWVKSEEPKKGEVSAPEKKTAQEAAEKEGAERKVQVKNEAEARSAAIAWLGKHSTSGTDGANTFQIDPTPFGKKGEIMVGGVGDFKFKIADLKKEAAEKERTEPHLGPDELINGISREVAGDMLASGDEDVLEHIREGVKKHGPELMQHAIRNQALLELAEVPKERRQEVRDRIARMQPQIDAILTGTGESSQKPPIPEIPEKGVTGEGKDGGIIEIADVADKNLKSNGEYAISSFVGVSKNAKEYGEWGGVMSPHVLVDAYFSDKPREQSKKAKEEIEEAFRPVREKIRKEYGDTITLYRYEDTSTGKDPNKRFLSYTLNKKFAEYLARGGRQEPRVVYDIKRQYDGYSEFVYSEDMPEGIKNSYLDKQIAENAAKKLTELTGDKHFIEEDLFQFGEAEKRKAKQTGTLRIDEINVDDIVWVTNRANQQEFIVKKSDLKLIKQKPPAESIPGPTEAVSGEAAPVSQPDVPSVQTESEPSPEAVPAPAEAKEPWQMTQREWNSSREVIAEEQNAIRSYGGPILNEKSQKWEFEKGIDKNEKLYFRRIDDNKNPVGPWFYLEKTGRTLLKKPEHHEAVQQALSENKPVPPEVLAEYPDLKTQEATDDSQKEAVKLVPSYDDWVSGVRFYYSGKDRSAELPDGERVLLGKGSTKKNFAEKNDKFLRHLYNNRFQAKPEPVTSQKPPQAAVPGAQQATEPAMAAKGIETEDAGAELAYNKRNRIKSGLKWGDIKDKDAALRVRETTKAKVYPKPDYDGLITDGMEPVVAHVIKQAYDAIAVKPRTRTAPTDENLQQYINAVNSYMDGVFKWAGDSNAVASWIRTVSQSARQRLGMMSGQVTSIFSLAEEPGKTLLDSVYPDGWKNSRADISIIGGNRALRALQPHTDEVVKAMQEIDKGWPKPQEAWQRQGYQIISGDGIEVGYYEGTDHTDAPYVSVWLKKGRRDFEQKSIDAKSKNDPAVTSFVENRLNELKGKSILVDKRFNLVGTFENEEQAREAARKAVEKSKKSPKIKDEGISVEAAKRVGKERRKQDENISSQKLMETFGFKGVNFGNWMKGKTNEAERQLHLNHAYDSFFDLAELLNIPPKAISLNGLLGIAIGAQGSGGFAAAHFVLGVNEINLTRTKGAGSLAHEWAHGLDHYFARLAGNVRGSEPFITEMTSAASENIRPEIVERFKKIVATMRKRPITEKERLEQIETREKRTRRNIDGWLAGIKSNTLYGVEGNEIGKEFDAIAKRISDLDLGDGKVQISRPAGRGALPTTLYPVVIELRELYKKAQGRMPGLDDYKALQANIDSLQYAIESKNHDEKHVPQVATTYLTDASKLDKEKGGKKYWSTSLEMFARAFDAYVSDRLEEGAISNTYLSHAGRTGDTVPGGDERLEINKAIDDLVSILKTKETDKGVTLYSTAPAPFTPANIKEELGDVSGIRIVTPKEAQLILKRPVVLPDGRTVNGFVRNGRVYLVQGHVASGRAKNEAMHEVSVHLRKLGMKQKAFQGLLDELYSHRGEDSDLGRAVDRAIRMIPKGTREEHYKEEVLAYLIGNGRTDISLVRRFIASVKRWLAENMKLPARFFSQDDIQALAVMALRGERETVASPVGEVAPVFSQSEIIKQAKALYSKLQQVAADKFTGMKAQGVLNFMNKQGVKKVEIEATGLAEWLKTRKPTDKVTKEELSDFVQANAVELEDVVLGGVNVAKLKKFIVEMGSDNLWYVVDPNTERLAAEGPFESEEDAIEYATGLNNDLDAGIYDAGGLANEHDGTFFSQYQEPGAEEGSYREMFVTAPGIGEIESFSAGQKVKSRDPYKVWQDGHGAYSDIQNPIVRIRFNTRTDSQGRKVLFIEEMQGPSKDNQAKMPAYLRDNIYNLGVKRILAYAKENGFDGVSWTTGEMQADRYDLSKQVDSVRIARRANDRFDVFAKKDGQTLIERDKVSASELEELVGKELAQKAVDDLSEPGKNKEYSDLDLKVGGEGLKSLYNKTLPDMFKAYGKEGAGEVDLTVQDSPEDIALQKKHGLVRKKKIVPFLPITQQTPESFPMFSTGKPIQRVTKAMLNTKQFKDWFGKSVIRTRSGQPVPVWHGTSDKGFLQGGEWAFDRKKGKASHQSPLAGLGNFFALDRTEAVGYAKGEGVVRPFYVSLQNPLVIESWKLNHLNNRDEAAAFAKRMGLRGHDGIIFPDQDHVVVFQPGNIKSAEYQTGEWDRTFDDTRFSVGPAVTEAFDVPEQHSLATTLKNSLKPGTMTREDVSGYLDAARTRLIDRLHPIKTLGPVAYKLHSLLGNTHAVFATFLHHGKLQWLDQALTITEKDKGFLPWFHSLGKDGRDFFYWLATKRAEVLEGEARENWLTDEKREAIREEIFAGMSGEQRAAKEKRFEQLNKEFQQFNANVLDIAIEAGLITEEQRNSWTRDFYLPFYRIMEDQATREEMLQGPRKYKKHVSAQIRRLKGGEEKLGDPLENVLRNWFHLIQESQRNVARAEAATVAVDQGLAEEISKKELLKIVGSKTTKRYGIRRKGNERVSRYFDSREAAEANLREGYEIVEKRDTQVIFGRKEDFAIMSYQREGQTVYLRVNDPSLYDALTDVNAKAFDSKTLKLMMFSKRLLTMGATFTPAFRIANMIRDTVHSFVVSKSFMPFVDTARGFVKVWKESPEFVALMASGGGFGQGWVESGDPKAMAREISKIIKRETTAKGTLIDTPRKALDLWQKIGMASEMAARVQLYSNLRKKGVSHMEAAFEARDLLDFFKSGAGNSVRVLIAVSPFLNARVQGLDRLYRGARQNPAAFMTKGAMVAAASLMLWMLFKDDDRYKDLEDWEKWQYHHFWIGDLHYRIPKAFETGALFSTLFESLGNVMAGNEDWEFFGRFVQHTLRETFAADVPVFFGPTIEAYANKSAFTGRPIESMAQQRMRPGERANPWTPELLKDLGSLTNISPVKAEHIIQGHTAAFGAIFLTIADAAYRIGGDAPSRPAKRLQDVPGIGRFVRDNDSRTKYATRYYEFAREVNELAAAVNNYKNLGEPEMAKKILSENIDTLRHRKMVNRVQARLSLLRKREKYIWNRRDMTPEQKRDELKKLTDRKNELVRRAYEAVNQ